MKTVIGFGKCYEILVKEFIVNTFKECDNKRSKGIRKVYVRGRCVDFSLEIINRFLGRNEEDQAKIEVSDNVICKEITAKKVKEWTRKGKLYASAMSVKYVVLYRIEAANWVPTNHTSNIATGLGEFIYIVGTKSNFYFGSYVFDQTMKHDASYAVKTPITFPSLICGVILSLHPIILINYESTCKRDPPLSLNYRLFTGKHVTDIVMTSKQTPSRSIDRTSILAELKDTCGVKDDGTDEEEEKEDMTDASDEKDTNSDED
ncbi:uncharacterized protein LOC127131743 [Lathyrus oleraceus]|uniref:uncharacterized protein LOC127131743 n=1 Tax=Pisum sativum TaxID=3888 RepID=UPI0021CF1284|nr:uncharacterized protein LOC127131743 [Pisum sativum]